MPTNNPGESFPEILQESPRPPGPSAAELQARYYRIKRRQQILGVIGIIFLVFLYVFLRHIAPVLWGGKQRRRLP